MLFNTIVRVYLKDDVLDPQGKTIGQALANLGFSNIIGISTGKIFRLEINADSEADAKKVAQQAAERLLSNPVIERFEFEIQR
jgi:phosphoribosylformylglycinamidine synthase PurS subunit